MLLAVEIEIEIAFEVENRWREVFIIYAKTYFPRQ